MNKEYIKRIYNSQINKPSVLSTPSTSTNKKTVNVESEQNTEQVVLQGPMGRPGPKGEPGERGVTPIKGVDYFDGIPGSKGDKGDPGEPGTALDISGKVDKITSYSLVADTEILKIHSSGSDNQDLSNLVEKETGKGLSTNDLTAELKSNYDGAVSHAGSTHAPTNAQVNNISDINAELLTGGQSTTLHSHAGGSGLTQSQVLTRGL